MTTSISNSLWLMLLLVAFAYANEKHLTDAHRAVLKNISEECLIIVDGTPDLLQNLREGKITNPDEKTKCFIKCVHEKSGVLVDGKYNKEMIVQKLGPIYGDDHLKETMEKCKGITGENECDRTYKVHVCVSGDHQFAF